MVEHSKHVLILTKDEMVRHHLRPMDQWLNLHLPENPIQALENIKDYPTDVFLVDVRVINSMIMALLSAVRNLPQYRHAPLVLMGESHFNKKIQAEREIPIDMNLRRIEEVIADVLNIRLIGRGTHGPHRGSAY